MSQPRPDLADLLAAIARRDQVAFRRLYDLTSAKLLGVALRIVRDRPAAEEVVQDTFVNVWRSAGSYSPEAGRPMTWLIAVARNRAIDVVRRRPEAAAPLVTDGGETVDVEDPRDREAELLDGDSLRVCLERLDETHRRCFLDAYQEGLSREQLAARYGRPVNTIKTWLHRSAASLRVCLDGL